MPAQWFIKKDNKWHGPHSFSALKALAEYGEIQRDDLVKDGLEGNPVRVGNINGQTIDAVSSNVGGSIPPQMPPLPNESKETPSSFPKGMPPLPNSPSPTLPLVSKPVQDSGESPEIWNPNVAIVWSFVLTLGFGSLILARNWRSLGQPEREDRCMYWFYAFAMYTQVMPSSDSNYVGLLWFCPILLGSTVLYFCEALPQIEFLQNNYRPKSWLAPFCIFFAVIGIEITLSGFWSNFD